MKTLKNPNVKPDQRHFSEALPKDQTVEVLYQKLGNKWYAFSLINDEVFVGSIGESEINDASSKNMKIKKLIANS